jgi:hypothetical protein
VNARKAIFASVLVLELTAIAPAQTPTVAPAGPSTVIAAAAPAGPPVLRVPYGPTSPWNRRVSANPTIAAYSAAVIARQFKAGNTQPVRNQEAGKFDYGHPVFTAVATDPLVKLVCNQYCSPGYPTRAYIPAKARPAGGSDAHMAVIQPDGSEIDLWALYGVPGRDWQTGDTATAGNVVNCGSYSSGSGFATAIGATAGQACLGAGIITAADLIAGQINHALFLVVQCAVGTQYPTPPTASTGKCTSGIGPALGGRLWLDSVAPPGLPAWSAAIWNALHTYGGYVMDDTAGAATVDGIAFMAASGEQTHAYGLPNPFAGVPGWSSIPISGALEPRWIGADPWNPPGLAQHAHWLAPCSAQGTC